MDIYQPLLPAASVLLPAVYAAANRLFGGPPRRFLGGEWSGRRLSIAVLALAAWPIGFMAAGIGGAVLAVIFGSARSIVIADDWSTPDTPKEVVLAFVRHLIPAMVVTAVIAICQVNEARSPFTPLLVLTLALYASFATALAIRFANKERELAADLTAGRISQADCDDQIGDENATTELIQGAAFGVAVVAWALLRGAI